ncbi:MAG: hypothetical protein KDJ90_00360 [Nitratireductor sp.]|nr:hypothetical protein [Nitratireductor sp.]
MFATPNSQSVADLVAALTARPASSLPVPEPRPLVAAPGSLPMNVAQPKQSIGGATSPDARDLVNSIIGQETRAPVKHWGQALARPILGLIKSQRDREARGYEESQKTQKADALRGAITGIRSGMNERGDVDLASVLAGINDPDMIKAVTDYADASGNRRHGQFDSDRRFAVGRSDSAFRRAIQEQENARAQGRFDRDMQDNWGEPRKALGPDGKPVFFQTNRAGETRQMPGDFRPDALDSDYNRKMTPAEAAKNREILAARQQILDTIAAKGRDSVIDDVIGPRQGFEKLVETARQSVVGASDPSYDEFLRVLGGGTPAQPAPGEGTQQRPAQSQQTMPADKSGNLLQRMLGINGMSAAERSFVGSKGQVTGIVPMRQDGRPDVEAMQPGQFYQFRDKDGKDRIVTRNADGSLEVVR